MSDFLWTDERVVELKGHFANGLSATEIARLMGIGTRSAVCGKLDRIGLKRGPKQPKQARPPRVRRRTPFRVPPRSDTPAPTLAPTPPAEPQRPTRPPIELFELTNESCRWPVTDDPQHMFCGQPEADAAHGIAYCRFHTRMAYRRPGDREAA